MTSPPAPPAAGPLLLIGGRFEDDNRALFDAIARNARGEVLVFATASSAPREVAAAMVRDLRDLGLRADEIDLTPETAREVAFDPARVARVAAAGGAYFSGGDQMRIRDALVIDGSETPMLAALRQMHAAGGLVAGSSAGAAMQSDPMILGGASGDALATGLVDDPDRPGLALAPGLGFFAHGLVDQHFIERGRIGRMAVALAASGRRFGFGVDENTGMLVRDGRIEVLGETGVVVMDMRHAAAEADGTGVRDIRVSYLDRGDGFDLATSRHLPGAGKRKARLSARQAVRSPAAAPRDVFGADAFHELWLRLARGDARVYDREAVATLDARTGARIDLVLRRRPRVSRVWTDGSRWSMSNFLLDLAVEGGARPFAGGRAARRPARDEAPERSPAAAPVPLAGRVRMAGSEAGMMQRGDNRDAVTLDWRGAEGPPEAALAALGSAGHVVLQATARGAVLDRVTRLGEDTALRDGLLRALRRKATVTASGEAAATFGHEAIVHGDGRAGLRWGVGPDAGSEGIVTRRGLGLVPGIVESDVERPGRFGRLILACAERQMIGWGLPARAGVTHYADAGQSCAFGAARAFMVSVEASRVESSPERLDLRDLQLMPLGEGRGGWLPAEEGPDLAEPLGAVAALVAGFAAELGATPEAPEAAGRAWLGDEVLLRLHMRRRVALLDISCHRARMTAAIR